MFLGPLYPAAGSATALFLAKGLNGVTENRVINSILLHLTFIIINLESLENHEIFPTPSAEIFF